MSTYKLPSNLDADEKLVGFLSLKQFLFVLGGCGISFLAYTFAKLNILLGIPFVPFMVVFFVLGLYQRKDQPVEVFLAAWLKFKFGSKKRIWNQEGYKQQVIVTAPKKEEIDYTKGYSAKEIPDKFRGLGSTLDTRGWASKGVYSQDSARVDPYQSERLVGLDDLERTRLKLDATRVQPSPGSFVEAPQPEVPVPPVQQTPIVKVASSEEVNLTAGDHEFKLR